MSADETRRVTDMLDRDTRQSTDAPPPSTELLIVGPAGYRTEGTGGIGRYIAEQQQYLDGRVVVDIVDTAVRTPDRPVEYLRTLVTILTGWVGFLGRSRPDVVHVHTSHQFSFYISTPYVLVASLLWGCPVILHVHGSSFDTFIEDASLPIATLQRWVFAACSATVALSEGWRDVLSQRADADRIVVVPNAVDPAKYAPAAPGPRPHLVFVSNHIERKGIVEVTEAVDRLQEAGVEFRVTIAGNGPLSHHATAVAEKHDAVDYRGYVSEAEKRALLNEGSVYVLPTRAEGLPIAILEAMAGGNAIVSTDVGAIASVVDVENGALVTPGAVDELTVTLERLLTAPSVTDRMGRVSRERIEDAYAWPDIVEELLSLYASVLRDDSSSTDRAAA